MITLGIPQTFVVFAFWRFPSPSDVILEVCSRMGSRWYQLNFAEVIDDSLSLAEKKLFLAQLLLQLCPSCPSLRLRGCGCFIRLSV